MKSTHTTENIENLVNRLMKNNNLNRMIVARIIDRNPCEITPDGCIIAYCRLAPHSGKSNIMRVKIHTEYIAEFTDTEFVVKNNGTISKFLINNPEEPKNDK